MVYKCIVSLCKGNSKTGPKVSTFKFPRDEELKKKWIAAIRRKDFVPTKQSRVCELHFKKTEIVTEATAYDPRTGVTIICPLLVKRLKKGVIPSLLLPTCDLVLSTAKSSSQQKNQLETGASNTVQGRLKWVPAKTSELEDSSQTSSTTRISESKKKETEEMVKRKRKSTPNEASNKKTASSSNLNGAHASNGVQTPKKSIDANSRKNDKPVCTNPEAFAFLNVQVKQEPLSEEDRRSGLYKNNPQEDTSESMQITNVRSLSSERSVEESLSAEETSKMKSDGALDTDFYSKPLDMDQRDKAFGSFVACELSDLRANPALYMKTKQSILKLLTEAHFEEMSFGKMS